MIADFENAPWLLSESHSDEPFSMRATALRIAPPYSEDNDTLPLLPGGLCTGGSHQRMHDNSKITIP